MDTCKVGTLRCYSSKGHISLTHKVCYYFMQVAVLHNLTSKIGQYTMSWIPFFLHLKYT